MLVKTLTARLQDVALLTALLIGAAAPAGAAIGRGRLTVAPTGRVKVQPGTALVLSCGGGQRAGVVQYWHTPFGHVQSSGVHGDLGPVAMQPDRSLLIADASHHHSGLYYCLLQAREGVTLWSYQISSAQNLNASAARRLQQGDGGEVDGAMRARRDAAGLSPEEIQAAVSDDQFAAAVAASVVVTFLLGFGTGALSRAHVLRCFGVVTAKVPLPRRRSPADTTHSGCEVSMTTLHSDWVFYDEIEARRNPTADTTATTPSPSPPAKPQRSFRHKREEQQETAAYLEGCDPTGEEESRAIREEGNRGTESGATGEERSGGSDGVVAEEERGSESEESSVATMEESGSEAAGGREEGKQSGEEVEVVRAKEDSLQGEGAAEEVEETDDSSQGNSSDPSSDTDGERENKDGGRGERGSKSQGRAGEEAQSPQPPPAPARRSRVIRLYQYDDEGLRYSHLPTPSAEEESPAPRSKQRSLSLTRLNAIMAAAASEGPLCASSSPGRETGREGEEAEEEGVSAASPSEKPMFKMDI